MTARGRRACGRPHLAKVVWLCPANEGLGRRTCGCPLPGSVNDRSVARRDSRSHFRRKRANALVTEKAMEDQFHSKRAVPTVNTLRPNVSTENQPHGAARRPSDRERHACGSRNEPRGRGRDLGRSVHRPCRHHLSPGSVPPIIRP